MGSVLEKVKIENEKSLNDSKRLSILLEKSLKSLKVKSESNYEDELCVFCYENQPNILIDPCCHGGICKECMITYLKNDGGKCPFGKESIRKLYLLEYDKEKKQLYATGEINLKK